MLARIRNEMLENIEHLEKVTQGLVVLAIANYEIYGIEPDKTDGDVYTIFRQIKKDLDREIKDIKASQSNGKSGWRPKKTYQKPKRNLSETQTKPKTNLKETYEKPNENLNELAEVWTVENVEQVSEKNDNSVLLYNNILNNNITEISNNITRYINYIIQELKKTANEIWIAYEKKDERNFCKHILTAKDYWELAEKTGLDRLEFAKSIMRASVVIKYRKGACSWPKAIYQNYVEVYNKASELHKKVTSQDGIF